ncbi:hypothetical protein ACFP56_10525 [Paenibacillus septentrionalis]|uniref:DUF4199 domain-containing protein n=1 Tax=Paenibacillus septentrionalis TaxID=429342 RepID=A0ABW1V2R3_9BACL
MKAVISLFITLTISFVLFMFGYFMTTTPGQTSGNGNPAILLFVPLFILFIVLIFQWFKLLKPKKVNTRTAIILAFAVICHQAIGLYYQVVSFQKYRIILSEVYEEQFGEIDWHYIDSITSGLSIHINNQYFNVNTFFLFVSLSFLIGLLGQIVLNVRGK